jgi:hypothetical protein
MIATETTLPMLEKLCVRSFSVTSFDKFPTYSLLFMMCSFPKKVSGRAGVEAPSD